MTYERKPVRAPRLRGAPLRLFVGLLEGPLGDRLLHKVTHDSGLGRFRETPAGDAPPLQHALPHPTSAPADALDPAQAMARIAASEPAGDERPETISAFADAYRGRRATPVEVAERVLAGMAQLQELRAFIASDPDDLRAQARASAERHARGRPLSALDGVPVAVKDEIDQAPYPTTVGTSFLGAAPAARDAALVARLRAQGALLIGKTNMHEVGINPVGINPHHGAARNPWNAGHITGGSSSGSAAAVAAGLCPLAIGADGGGSIRIPAALCGVVGLKPTWGRVSERGAFPLCWHVGHAGPIALSARDAAIGYAAIAGRDADDPGTHAQPPVDLRALSRMELTGVRLGLCAPSFNDADPSIVKRCAQAVDALVARGATVVEVPAPNLETQLWSHAVLILTEMATALAPHIEADRTRFGLDVRTNLAIGRFFTATDYTHALRHRNLRTAQLWAQMQEVDAIVTPTTATAAPPMPELALPDGESNLVMTDALMRFVRDANLSGFPAIAVPAGFDDAGLPVSLQLMGRPWEEDLLLRLALAVEERVPRRTPARHVTLLAD